MNRLQKKCILASLGLHGLLVAILFVGPAFLSSNDFQAPEVIDFVPSKLVDAAVSGGGNPNAQPPQAQPQPEPPKPAPVAPPPKATPQPEPEPERQPASKTKAPPTPEPETDPDSLEMTKHKPKISLKVKTAKNGTSKTTSNDNKAREREQAEARQRLASQIGRIAASIGKNTASATTVEEFGPGGGGPAYASYISEVQRIYREAWAPPEETANDNAITRARITIANDGRVIRAQIIGPSGDIQVDNSVRFTLDRVKFIAPFPEGAKDKERTYIIKFDLKVKRGLA